MALPLLAPAAIIAAIASLFAGLLKFFAEKLAKRILIIGLIITAFVAATAALAAALSSVLNGIAQSAPSGWVASGLALLPGNTNACISALIVAHGAAFLYRQKVALLNFKSNL